METQFFTNDVIEKLSHYVYRLIDPRNGETFYVGKGKGNRVFDHVNGSTKEDALSEKMARIHSIRLAGFEVAHVIHRHGMDRGTALHVEAALIDAYPGITNIMDGHGNSDFGAMHASEVVKKYAAPVAELTDIKAILINVHRSALDSSIYESTRYAWRINKSKAEQADLILATLQGIVIEVFVADRWLEANSENFPGKEPVDGRFGFIGRVAQTEFRSKYIHKRLPDEYRKKGASNPIKYTW
jgi:hypothetical protein